MKVVITKDDGDRLLENFLVGASKANGSIECAEESIKIMDRFEDAQLIVSVVIANSMRNAGEFPKDVIDFEVEILSAITTMYSTCIEEEIPVQFGGLFSGTEDEILDKVGRDKKIHYAVRAFIEAFYTFDNFEKQYPEITKML